MDAVTQRIRVLAILNHTPGGKEHDQQKHAGDNKYSSQGIVGHFQGKPIRKGTYSMSHAKAVEEVKRVAPLMDKIAKTWKRAILKHDPKAKVEIRGTKDYLDRIDFNEAAEPNAWLEVDGETSKGEGFGLRIALYPQADGNILKMNDSSLPKSLQKKGIFSAGIEAATKNPEFNLSGKLSVHFSTNNKAWQRIADKYGFSWKEWQEGAWIDVPDKDLYLFQNSVVVNHTPGGHPHDQDKHGNDKGVPRSGGSSVAGVIRKYTVGTTYGKSDISVVAGGDNLPESVIADIENTEEKAVRIIYNTSSNQWHIPSKTMSDVDHGNFVVEALDGFTPAYTEMIQVRGVYDIENNELTLYDFAGEAESIASINNTNEKVVAKNLEKALREAAARTFYVRRRKPKVTYVPFAEIAGFANSEEVQPLQNTALLIRINAVLRGLHNHKGPGDHPSGSSQDVHGGGSQSSGTSKYSIPKDKTLFHFTKPQYAASIMEKGLLPKESANEFQPLLGKGVYFTDESGIDYYSKNYGSYSIEATVDVENTLVVDGYLGYATWIDEHSIQGDTALDGSRPTDLAKHYGYDSVYIKRSKEKGGNIYIIFDSKNIKMKVKGNSLQNIRIHAVLNRTALALRLPTVITNHEPGGHKHDQQSHAGDDTSRLDEDLALHETYSNRWRSASDYDARDIAIGLQKNNKALHRYMLEATFGEELGGTVVLYRVGRTASSGTTSFFTKRSFAEAYQKRMGVEGIEEQEFNIWDIYPSTPGGKEVWVDIDAITNEDWWIDKE